MCILWHTLVKPINKPFEEKVRTLSASSFIYDTASSEMGFYSNVVEVDKQLR